MTLFLRVIEHGSFSAAARSIDVPVQTVSRKIADLERHLGAQLLQRTTRNLALTDAGSGFAAAARRIVASVEEAEREAAGEFVTPKGDLVITAPLFFGRLHVVPIVTDFLAAYPEINIHLVLRDTVVDLLDAQIDAAVRIGRLPDSGMIATRVGEIRVVAAASPVLLAHHGVPKTPAALGTLPCIATDGATVSAAWRFRDPDTRVISEALTRPRLTTGAEAAAEAAIRGAGVVRALSYQVHDAVRDGALSLILEQFELDPLPVHLVHLPREQLPLKMRHFLDFAAPRVRRTLRDLTAWGRPD
ncbi:LysR family transcriptional regulator [Sphingomonas sp. UYP23]